MFNGTSTGINFFGSTGRVQDSLKIREEGKDREVGALTIRKNHSKNKDESVRLA